MLERHDRSQRLRTFARRLRAQSTDAERKLWSLLRGEQLLGLQFRRQHPIGGYIVDFVCLKANLVVELDGGQHADAGFIFTEPRNGEIEMVCVCEIRNIGRPEKSGAGEFLGNPGGWSGKDGPGGLPGDQVIRLANGYAEAGGEEIEKLAGLDDAWIVNSADVADLGECRGLKDNEDCQD